MYYLRVVCIETRLTLLFLVTQFYYCFMQTFRLFCLLSSTGHWWLSIYSCLIKMLHVYITFVCLFVFCLFCILAKETILFPSSLRKWKPSVFGIVLIRTKCSSTPSVFFPISGYNITLWPLMFKLRSWFVFDSGGGSFHTCSSCPKIFSLL